MSRDQDAEQFPGWKLFPENLYKPRPHSPKFLIFSAHYSSHIIIIYFLFVCELDVKQRDIT